MASAIDFLHHRPTSDEARVDEDAVRVLFVEDSHDFARQVCSHLDHAARGHFDIVHCTRLTAAIEDLKAGEYDVVLLDLSLPDSDREHTIDAASDFSQRVPVVVLTGTEAEASAEERLDRAELPRTLLAAIRRHRRLGCTGCEPVICRIPN